MLIKRSGTRRLLTALFALSLCAVLAVGLAACGSSSSSSSSSAEVETGSETERGESETAGDTEEASGEPIKVMVQSSIEAPGQSYAGRPNAFNAAEAYEQWINAKGGINGHPLEVVTCDDKQEEQLSVDCARTAVKENVVASVGGESFYGQNVVPIYEQANIAWFGPDCNLSPIEYSSPVAFPLSACSLGWSAGNIVALVKDGSKSPGFVDIAIADAEQLAEVMKNVGKSLGVTVKIVTLPSLTVPDMTPYVSEISKGTDGYFPGPVLSATSLAQWMTAYNQLGGTQTMAFNAGILGDEASVEKYSKELEGSLTVDTVSNVELPQWADFRKAMEGQNVPPGDPSRAQNEWASLVAFTKIVETISGPVDHESFLEAASGTTELDTGGLMANMNLTEEYKGLDGEYPRMFNRNVSVSILKNGKLEPFEGGKFIDVTKVLEGKPFE